MTSHKHDIAAHSMIKPRISQNRLALGDVVAGFSVAVVLIPQALAYSELAGLPAHHGLYAAALPTIAAAFFASSRYLQTGPAAMTSLLTLGAVSAFAPVGTPEYVALAALLALMVGVARVIVGTLRAGWITYLMSQPVLTGFTTGAAILIVASQLPTAFGMQDSGGSILDRALSVATSADQWSFPTIFLAAVTAVLVFGSRFIHRLFPGVVIAIVGGIVFSKVFDYTGSTIGEIPRAFQPLSFSLPWTMLPVLLLPGLVIAIVGFAEVAAISRSFATQDRERWNPNREFAGQGVANIVSGFVGGFPIGGSFSRSAIGRLTGGQTRWSGACTGVFVLAFLPFSGILAELPKAVLAGIVIGAVTNLIRISDLVHLTRRSWFQAGIAWTTFLVTLMLSPRVDLAVLIGIALSILVHLYRESKLRVFADFANGDITLKPHGVLYFGSAPGLDSSFREELARHADAKGIVIDLSNLGRVDYTGAISLKQIMDDATSAGLAVRIVSAPPQARGILNRVFGPDIHTSDP